MLHAHFRPVGMVAALAAGTLLAPAPAGASGHTAADAQTARDVKRDRAASARSKAKTAHCKRGKVAVRRGKLEACLKTPRDAARTRPTRAQPNVRAAWYDNAGTWHTDGKLHYQRRWPTTGWYRSSNGGYFYYDQWTETAGYNLTTLYVYRYWNGSGWSWWGDYQCMGLNNGVYRDACYWFAAR